MHIFCGRIRQTCRPRSPSYIRLTIVEPLVKAFVLGAQVVGVGKTFRSSMAVESERQGQDGNQTCQSSNCCKTCSGRCPDVSWLV
mmetsp:Transcript_5992/g.9576  ORF Transcript_5992/g.9576 Transcript_5992/m.9576 type:complete len:85 (+) Transcript_5992:830-1084(+)